MNYDQLLGTYGLWALIITIGTIIFAGVIHALTKPKTYQRKPTGKTVRTRKKIPKGKK